MTQVAEPARPVCLRLQLRTLHPALPVGRTGCFALWLPAPICGDWGVSASVARQQPSQDAVSGPFLTMAVRAGDRASFLITEIKGNFSN